MENYNEIFETVKTILTDNNKAKADAQSVKFATGYYAVSFCHSFKEWKEYDSLFTQLKTDLKKINLKFAGSPLAKACLVTATAVIDCKVNIDGDSDEMRFEDFKEILKKSGLNFSSKQGDVRLALGKATDSDIESAKAELLKRIGKAIECLSENAELLTAEQSEKMIEMLEARYLKAEKSEKAA